MRKLLIILPVAFVLAGFSCVKQAGYRSEVISYFKDVALGLEFGHTSSVVRKWNTDMKIFIGGEITPELQEELTRIIAEINSLASDGFDIAIVPDTLRANTYLFFGKGETFAKRVPEVSDYVATNEGMFWMYWNRSQQLIKAFVYVDTKRGDLVTRKHLLREELTQSLGLAVDSKKYDESIFQSRWTATTEYAKIDRDLIRILYSPDMKAGTSAADIQPLLENITSRLRIAD